MMEFKRMFALVVGIASCVIAALASVYGHYGAEGLAAVIFTLLSVGLFVAICFTATVYIYFHDK